MTALLLIVAAIAVGWVVSVRLWPIRPCPRCGGTKRSTGSNSRRWDICGRCGGKGDVRRFGAGRGQ